MAIRHEDRALIFVRNKIASEPKDVQDLIMEGERIIDGALVSNPRFGIGPHSDDLVVFPLDQKINPLVRDLLDEIYDTAGYTIRWKARWEKEKATEMNVVNLTPKGK